MYIIFLCHLLFFPLFTKILLTHLSLHSSCVSTIRQCSFNFFNYSTLVAQIVFVCIFLALDIVKSKADNRSSYLKFSLVPPYLSVWYLFSRYLIEFDCFLVLFPSIFLLPFLFFLLFVSLQLNFLRDSSDHPRFLYLYALLQYRLAIALNTGQICLSFLLKVFSSFSGGKVL